MRDDPRKNLKWLEQELMAEEVFHEFSDPARSGYEDDSDDDLLALVDMLLEEDEAPEEEEPPIRNFANNYGRNSKSVRAERSHAARHFDEDAAVAVKSRRQLRKDAKQQKREEIQKKNEEKKAGINRNIKGLVFLAALECIGILVIIGWWLQWLI